MSATAVKAPFKLDLLLGRKRRRYFTPQQVHEIRMAPEGSDALAKRLHLGGQTILRIRSEAAYGPLTADEREAAWRRVHGDCRPWRDSDASEQLVVARGHIWPVGLQDESRLEALDATYECRHGALPGDPEPVCGCWDDDQLLEVAA